MNSCRGAPAELNALNYVEGTLSESKVEKFEEHYFDCPACLARLQAIQAVGRELACHPVAPPRQPKPRIQLGWPAWCWSMGAVAALLLMSVLMYRSIETKPAQPSIAQSQPKSSPQTESAAQPAQTFPSPVHLSQLADLTLPAFIAPNLRGESLDARFNAGMKEYADGDCHGALAALSQVTAESAEARAAEFYSGACQMRLGDFASASKLLHKVADTGDSPQQEGALYALAQIALAGNDPATARTYLLRTISLRGDFEGRARKQDRRITELTGQSIAAEGKIPAAK
jgi:TolA-binding protein